MRCNPEKHSPFPKLTFLLPPHPSISFGVSQPHSTSHSSHFVPPVAAAELIDTKPHIFVRHAFPQKFTLFKKQQTNHSLFRYSNLLLSVTTFPHSLRFSRACPLRVVFYTGVRGINRKPSSPSAPALLKDLQYDSYSTSFVLTATPPELNLSRSLPVTSDS